MRTVPGEIGPTPGLTSVRAPSRGLLARGRACRLAATACAVLAAWACGSAVNVQQALQVTDVVTGYYDVGVVDGKNKLVPSISFQVRNTADRTVSSVQLNAVFRVVGDQEELGSAFVRGIDASGLAPGASTEAFVLRSSLGYTGEQPRAQMLQHKEFRDVQVEVFAKHGAEQWVKLGQYKVDRQLLTR
jgi:hypothetical protein